MAAPRILAIIEVDGKEMAKKPVRARTIDECRQEAVKKCPQIAALQLQRAFVYDKGFEDYIDYDEHVPVENDKIRLQFVSLAQQASVSAVQCEVPSMTSSEGASSSPGGDAARARTSFEDNSPKTSQATRSKFTGKKLSISREPPSQTPPVSDLTDEEMEDRAKIFGKGGKNPNKYQKKINEAASRLAKANPSLLDNKGLLLEKAREQVHDSGYEYAHGKRTRSKVFGSEKQKMESNYSKEAVKLREDRLEEITEIVQSMETQMKSQTPPVSDLTVEEMEDRAKIFGKGGKNLNKYQKKINEAASRLAKANPTLLDNKGLLLEKAREQVHDSGYEYAHGKKTRSKVFGSEKQKKESNYSKEAVKLREDRLEEITEIVQSMETQMKFLEKGKERALTSNQFGQAASFEQQISELKLKLRKLKLEKAEIGNKIDALKKRRVRRKNKGRESDEPSSKTVKVMGDSQAYEEEVNIMEERSGEIETASIIVIAEGSDERHMYDIASDDVEGGGSYMEERSRDIVRNHYLL